MIANTACFSTVPITAQASLRLPKIVGCAVRTRTGHRTEGARCAWRTLRSLHSNRSYSYAFRSRSALTNTSPPVSPGGEMITSRSGCAEDFAKEWNNLVYCRLSKMLCAFKDQVRARPSGGTGGLRPAPAPVIGEKFGLKSLLPKRKTLSVSPRLRGQQRIPRPHAVVVPAD